jgi:hypothetical protein
MEGNIISIAFFNSIHGSFENTIILLSDHNHGIE